MKDPQGGSDAVNLMANLNDSATSTIGDSAQLKNISDSLNEPDGDFVEMYFGWQQINLSRERSGIGGPPPDENKKTTQDNNNKSSDYDSSDMDAGTDVDMEDVDMEDADLGMGFYERMPDDSGGVGGMNKVVAGIIGPRVHRPDPDGGGEEPGLPGPGKKSPGSTSGNEDEGNSSPTAPSAGNFPFVGEGDTVIHPRVNVLSEVVSNSINSDFTNAGFTPDPDDGDPTPPPVLTDINKN
ncbi:MAG TPA: hypothetical protein VLH08_01295 [Acidobacteriota bacterium]|nr:hypothetical protein [Acidobacteriota bacterium]